VYESEYYHSIKKKLSAEVWEEDKERIDFLRNQGYDVLVI
jgi:hypothetical protein